MWPETTSRGLRDFGPVNPLPKLEKEALIILLRDAQELRNDLLPIFVAQIPHIHLFLRDFSIGSHILHDDCPNAVVGGELLQCCPFQCLLVIHFVPLRGGAREHILPPRITLKNHWRIHLLPFFTPKNPPPWIPPSLRPNDTCNLHTSSPECLEKILPIPPSQYSNHSFQFTSSTSNGCLHCSTAGLDPLKGQAAGEQWCSCSNSEQGIWSTESMMNTVTITFQISTSICHTIFLNPTPN